MAAPDLSDPSATPAGRALVEALAAHAAAPSPAARTAVFAALLAADVLLPTPDAPDRPGTCQVVEREILSVVTTDDGEGHVVMPAFTGAGAALAWQPDGAACARRAAAELFRIAVADSEGKVGIDLGSPTEFVVEPHEIAALAEGFVPGAPPAADASASDTGSGQVLVATPVDPLPPEVADAVRDAVDAEPAVERAALFLLHSVEGAQLAVVIEFAPGTDEADDIAPVMERIVASVATRTDAAGGLTMLVATPEWGTTFDDGGIELFSRRR